MAEAEPARKKRRGGTHQRMEQAAADVERDSALESLLLESFASGEISGAFCHALMQAAVQDIKTARDDGATFPLMEKLAGVKHGKNFQQSLELALQRKSKLVQPTQVSIPLKGGPEDRPSCNILLPHEMLHGMFVSGGGWERCVVPTADLLPRFWASFRDHPCMSGHPILGRADYHEKAIPLCLHGDEVPVMGVGKIWCHSALQFSFNSMLATAAGRSAEDTQMFVFGIFEKFVLPETMPAFFELLRWSFEVCLAGKWPARDWRGIRHPYAF